MTWRHIIFGHFDEMKRCNDDVELKYNVDEASLRCQMR